MKDGRRCAFQEVLIDQSLILLQFSQRRWIKKIFLEQVSFTKQQNTQSIWCCLQHTSRLIVIWASHSSLEECNVTISWLLINILIFSKIKPKKSIYSRLRFKVTVRCSESSRLFILEVETANELFIIWEPIGITSLLFYVWVGSRRVIWPSSRSGKAFLPD